MKTKKTVFIFAAALTILVAAVFYYAVLLPPNTGSVASSMPQNDAFSFVKSMEGTTTDGQATQTNDALIVDASLRRLFEYYLAATGEKSLAEIRAEIEKELDKTLSPSAARQAKEVLTRYLTYKQELAEIEKNPAVSGNDTNAIKHRFSSMQQLRRRYFNKKEDLAMFGFDDAYDMDAIARLEISQDSALTNEQKQKKLLALDAAMPTTLREEKQAPYRVLLLEENVVKMRARGASDDDIYRLRASSTTPEAAARLADLDREEIEWKTRITTYLAERSRLLSNLAEKPEQERQAAMQKIRDQQFNQGEQKRLSAYE